MNFDYGDMMIVFILGFLFRGLFNYVIVYICDKCLKNNQ
jgi:hypothetical protein